MELNDIVDISEYPNPDNQSSMVIRVSCREPKYGDLVFMMEYDRRLASTYRTHALGLSLMRIGREIVERSGKYLGRTQDQTDDMLEQCVGVERTRSVGIVPLTDKRKK